MDVLRFYFLTVFVAITSFVAADTEPVLEVVRWDNAAVSTALEDVHKVTFNDDETLMTIVTHKNGNKTVPIQEVRKIVFVGHNLETSIETTVSDVLFTVLANDAVVVKSSNGIKKIDLYDMNGRLLFTQGYSQAVEEVRLSIAALSQGIYIAHVGTTQGTASQKISIQ